MAIDIFDVITNRRKEIERELIDSHIKIYGASPIAQGASGILVDDIDNIDETKAKDYFE